MPDFAEPILLHDLRNLALALAIGFLIGFEREHAQAAEARGHGFAGARTFTLTAFAGALSVFVDASGVTTAVLLAAVAVLTAAAYWAEAREKPWRGGTTEIALFVTFLLGAAAAKDLVLIAAIGGVATAIILSIKKSVERWAASLSAAEFSSALRFLAISIIILPVLPGEPFGPYDAFNAREFWLMVIFISGLSFSGYWLIKLTGQGRGLFLTGLAGGLASSTAATLSLARYARNGAAPDAVAAGIVAANAMMLIRVGVVTAALSRETFAQVWPALASGAAAGLAACVVLRRRAGADAPEPVLEMGNPMEIRPALVFAGLLALVSLAAAVAADRFGESGLLAVALASGLADVDAMTLVAGRQAAAGALGAGFAAIVIAAAVLANVILKGAMAFSVGGAKAGGRVCAVFALMALAGGAVMAF